MTSPPMFKELSKAINAYIPKGTLPLPDNLVDLIEGYLRKHEDKFEDSIADKVNDELLSIFHSVVVNNSSRYAPFVAVLRRLRPLIGEPEKVLKWTDLLMPILDHLTQEKDLAHESQALVLDILTADEDNDASSPIGGAAALLADKLLCIWLEKCFVAGRLDDTNQIFKERHIRETLLQYGRKRPKDLMTIMDKYFIRKSHRARILLLAADFVKSQPPHLYTILQTPLFGNLLTCLQQDTSSTIVSLALGVVAMVLPHIPSSLVPYLPTLFNIYARLLFWERMLSDVTSTTEPKQDSRFSPSPTTWEKCHFSTEQDLTSVEHLMSFYTILYGLYPLNFTDYIRKPQRYLRHAEVAEADEVEVQPTEIRHATERFRQCHLLHENFYTLTIESEKTDFGRWIKSEPAEVVADCVALCVAPEWQAENAMHDVTSDTQGLDTGDVEGAHEATLLGGSYPGDTSDPNSTHVETWEGATSTDTDASVRPQPIPAIVRNPSQISQHTNRDSPATRIAGEGPDSPSLPRQLTTSGSQTRLQDMINSNKAIKSGLHQTLKNDSVPSLSLSQHESISERLQSHLTPGVPLPNPQFSDPDQGRGDSKGHLYRQILLLQNDLTFERFMKQQHLTHMGELRRRQLREAATEAEAQNLMITNRHLRQRLAEAKSTEIQVKKEAESRRTLSKKWEADLTTKLRALREEQKKWVAREKNLVAELEAAKSENEKLVQLVCDAEVRELSLKQNMQSVELHVSELERLRKEVERATEAERNFQAREAERQAALTSAEEADSRAEALKLKLTVLEQELQQNQERHQKEVSSLNNQLQAALKKGVEPHIEDLQSKVDATIAGARAQQEQFRKRMVEYAQRNYALQSQLLDLQSNLPMRTKSVPSRSNENRISREMSSDSEGVPQTRLRRRISNPELYDSTASLNASTSSEPRKSTASAGSQDVGPLMDAGSEHSETSTAERYIGRGGVQNSRKDKKDKKDKKDDKDKRRLVGIRGIRGFV